MKLCQVPSEAASKFPLFWKRIEGEIQIQNKE